MTNPISLEQVSRVLEGYGIAGARLQQLSEVDCIVFRVTGSGIDGAEGEGAAILKVYPAYKKNPDNIRAEVEWLQALKSETGLRVPRPLPARDGSIVQSISIGQAEGWPGVLFSWVEGESLDRELTTGHLKRIGAFVGTLHRHSHGWHGASLERLRTRTFTQRVFGWVLDMEQPRTLEADAWNVLQRAAGQLEAETLAFGLDPSVYGFIHSDLYLSNFLFQGDSVGVIDFSDCALGHYADDIASALVFLKYPWVGNFDHSAEYPRLKDAFFEGYQSVEPLPRDIDVMLDTYFAARILLLLAYVHEAREHVSWVPDCVARCRRFLEEYLGR